VIVVTQSSPNGFVRRVFEVGADDVVVLPETQDGIKFALQKAMARKSGTTGVGSLATAPLIAVLGPKGGTGKTLVSTNLAVALAMRGRKVALLDLDLQFGDVGLCLGYPRSGRSTTSSRPRHHRLRQARGVPDTASVGRTCSAGAEQARPGRVE
jgi:pilus assembly protein CpaE